ncbi:hypothetical protein M747DRAFT_45886 [Aspergillus niger ATCC 13496]|uniref:Uncharacterized protein n=1 Tax=Aspergillus niger ATCC 13496 TaxID=1353008 RepID=A0A370C0C0_ASPNG|nr:hypothetical protein M747DRAFT_45886 [Aspergillus niger ATCC 13496]
MWARPWDLLSFIYVSSLIPCYFFCTEFCLRSVSVELNAVNCRQTNSSKCVELQAVFAGSGRLPWRARLADIPMAGH